MQLEIKHLQENLGITVIYVTTIRKKP